MSDKLIFLDIDGVLNSHSQKYSNYNLEFLPHCVQAFNSIVRATEAKIVLSSSWRYYIFDGHMDVLGFGVLLRSHGVNGHLIGHTRANANDGHADWEPRWMQIRDYLKGAELPRYCILDDDPDAFGGRPGVQTNGNGLTEADAKLAIEILTEGK